MNRHIAVLALLLLLCAPGYSQNFSFSWQSDPLDGHITGVKASNADNVPSTMGVMKGRKYVSPSGKVFRRGVTPAVAAVMLGAQDAMAVNKRVIAHSARVMGSGYPECELYDWYVDELMRAVQDSTGKKVHIGIANRGGVRTDMPEGDVLHDDIMSMFPFRNSICYVALHGRDILAILDQMAGSRFQIVGGVKVIAKDGKVISAKIDGEPVGEDRIYGVATLDFLLDGGDGYHVARNAVEVIKCNGYLYDTMLAYVRSLEAQGLMIESENRGWITLIGEGNIDED
ncbi:MAG: 5'-nucleotidase C-terminal domain-containing protein [Candidatus Cryptobacteroides sp.]